MSPFACSTRYVPYISRVCTPGDFAITKRSATTVLFVMAETVGAGAMYIFYGYMSIS